MVQTDYQVGEKLQVLGLARIVGHRALRILQIYYNETATGRADRPD